MQQSRVSGAIEKVIASAEELVAGHGNGTLSGHKATQYAAYRRDYEDLVRKIAKAATTTAA